MNNNRTFIIPAVFNSYLTLFCVIFFLFSSLQHNRIWHKFGQQSYVKHLFDSVDMVEYETIKILLLDIGDILAVFLRKNDIRDARTLGGKYLLLNAAYRHHLSA